MNTQKLLSLTRQAIDKYNMIDEGDSVAVGISGGKDSLTLLYLLAKLRDFYPKHFTLKAITINLGYEDVDFSAVRKLCQELSVEYRILDTQIYEILKQKDTGKPFCSLCARLRRGAIKQVMEDMGCNKLAYAHHKDDVIETAVMSLLNEGQFYCFPPVTNQDSFSVIRPLIYVPEYMIKSYSASMDFPIVFNPCPYDHNSQRSVVKSMIEYLARKNRTYKSNIFHAVTKIWDTSGG